MLSLGLGAAPALGRPGTDQIVLDIGEASAYRQHQAPGAGARCRPKVPPRIGIALSLRDVLDDAEEIEPNPL